MPRGPRSAHCRMISTAIGSTSSRALFTAALSAASQPPFATPVVSWIRTTTGALAATALAAFWRVALKAVLLDLRVEEAAIDAEHLGGLGAVAVRVPEGLHDQILLELGHGLLEERAIALCLSLALALLAIACLMVAEGKLATRDDLATRQDDGAFDDVLELANVAGPVVFHESADGLFADRRGLGRRAVTVLREEVLD